MKLRGLVTAFDGKWRLTVSRVCQDDWTPIPAMQYARSMGRYSIVKYYFDNSNKKYTRKGFKKKLEEMGYDQVRCPG